MRQLFDVCDKNRWTRVALAGSGDLAEIATLCQREGSAVEIIGIINTAKDEDALARFAGLPVVDRLTDLAKVHAVIVTDIVNAQKVYDRLSKAIPPERILTAPLKVSASCRGWSMTEQSIPAPDRWFVAKTRPNGEQKALFHLRRQGFDVYLPQFLRRISHARRVSWQPRLYSPAICLSPCRQRSSWRAINSTIGISHLICDDRGPVPVPPGVVNDLRDAEDERGLVLTGRKIPFKKGAAVQIMSGAFLPTISAGLKTRPTTNVLSSFLTCSGAKSGPESSWTP